MKKNTKKTLWYLLLLFDLVVFSLAIYSTNVPSLILAAVLAGIIHFKGNDAMFGEFDRKRKEQILARKKELLRLKNKQGKEV